MPAYTIAELREFVYAQDNFNNLFDAWAESGYKTPLVPSIDRIDDYKHYTLDNIRLTTWAENNAKAFRDRRNGVNNKLSKAVEQFTLEGKLIKRYHSTRQAAREAGISQGNIISVAKGRLNTAGKFRWKYVTQGDEL